MSRLIGVSLVIVLAGVAPSVIGQDQRPRIRFQSMDTDGDGRITRAEWRGSERSFRIHDWNGDGVLSGDELRLDGRRQAAWDDVDFDSPDREYDFTDWTPRGFANLDHNRDGRITRDEWHFNRESFRRADHNRDGVISRAEFLNEDSPSGWQDDDRDDRFAFLDVNRDGRISRDEWHGTEERFAALDDNRDGYLSRQELLGNDEPPPDLFTSVDINRDGWITRNEWHWSARSFDERDTNRDGRLSRDEFSGATTPVTSRSQTYRAGYERGLVEGRQAGREDATGPKVWDLEGQRELEQADSGYEPRLGPRAEYQQGYRDGFRKAYREGFYGR